MDMTSEQINELSKRFAKLSQHVRNGASGREMNVLLLTLMTWHEHSESEEAPQAMLSVARKLCGMLHIAEAYHKSENIVSYTKGVLDDATRKVGCIISEMNDGEHYSEAELDEFFEGLKASFDEVVNTISLHVREEHG